jgi:hypothetical protein
MQPFALIMLAVAMPMQASAQASPQTAEIEKDSTVEGAIEGGAARDPALPAADAPAKEGTGMFSTVGLFTIGGGVLGAVVAGGLVVLSPCLCGLPLACPIAAAATGAGAGIGALVASEGDMGRAFMPTLVGAGVGGAAGVLAGVLALGTAVLIDSTLPNPGLNAGGAAFNVGVASITAGGVALVLIGAGSFAAAGGSSWAYQLSSQAEADDDSVDPPADPQADPPTSPEKPKKKKPQGPPAGDQVAMVF